MLGVAFCLGVLVAALVLRRRRRSWAAVGSMLGLRRGPFVAYVALLPFTLATLGVLFAAGLYIAPDYFQSPPQASTLSGYATMSPGVVSILTVFAGELLLTALGEELLFRGLIFGWLLERLEATAANVVQAVIFLAPHLLLLIAAPGLWWLVLIMGLGGGLALGWVRQRTGSIWPGTLAHAIGNTTAADVVMVLAY